MYLRRLRDMREDSDKTQQQIADLRKMLNSLPEGEERKELLKEFMNLTRSLAETGRKGACPP